MTKTLNPTPTFCWKLCTATAATPLLLLSNPVACLLAVLLARNELSAIPQMNRQCTASSLACQIYPNFSPSECKKITPKKI
jgi:hypothetical protein